MSTNVVVCTELSGKEPHRQVGVGMVVISGCLGDVMVSVVVCTELSGKEPQRQVGVGRVVKSGRLGGVMVSVVVCTELSGKEPHRQEGVGMVVISGCLGGIMTSLLCTGSPHTPRWRHHPQDNCEPMLLFEKVYIEKVQLSSLTVQHPRLSRT